MKNNKGITLIALIITIIILLILSGISIATLVGNNGVLEQATQASVKTKIANLKEEISLINIERTIDSSANFKQELEKEISGNKIIEEISAVNGVLPDAYYVTRDGVTVTVYEDGTIEEGKIGIWNGVDKVAPTVDEEGNWHIYTTEELKFFADFVNGDLTEEEKGDLTITETTTVYLENNLDLGARQQNGVLTVGAKWTPIGITSATKFQGIFEGNNYYITGVYVEQTVACAGLFGNSNTIQNLTIKNSYISGITTTGGIVGALRSGKLENCHNINTTVVLKEGSYTKIGGIAGQAQGTISECTNSGDIIANGKDSSNNSIAGGIVGQVQGKLNNLINNGIVKSEGSALAGIAGALYPSSQMTNVTNNGTITGLKMIGGIVGQTGGVIEKATNTGNITGTDMVGGITGNSVSGASIKDSKNKGIIKGDIRVGGIAGTLKSESNSIVENSTNIGKIISDGEFVGGIVGTNGAIIRKSVNKGEVVSKDRVGGIAGSTTPSGIIENCSNTGIVTAYVSTAGGISGMLFGNIEKCYNVGQIKLVKKSGYIAQGTGGLGGICAVIGANCTATIKNCYNKGLLIAELDNAQAVGGVIGLVSESETSGTISNNYNVGNIEIKGKNIVDIGGVIGKITTDAITRANNYYLEGTIKAGDNNEGESKAMVDMKTEEFVSLLNAGETVWTIDSSKNEGYPIIIGNE